jgi:hypothetical protein
MVSRLKIAQRETLHLHILQQTDNVGCRNIESCEYHRFFCRHFCDILTRCSHNPTVPTGKLPHFLFRVLLVSIRTSLFSLSTVRYTSLLQSLFKVEKNDKMIMCGKWERMDAFWPIWCITTAFVFRTMCTSKHLVRIAGVLPIMFFTYLLNTSQIHFSWTNLLCALIKLTVYN